MRFYAALHAASSAVKSAALCGAMLWLLVMTNFGSALAQTPPAGQPQPLHVLVIHSYHAGYGSSDAVMKGIENSFHGAAEEVELFIEYLDAKRLLDQSYLEQLHRILAFKYSRLRIDLVIASDNDALEFILKNRSTICAEKPVVFAGVSDFMPSMLAGQANITGVVEASEYRANIELAQKILPHLTEIVVISDRTTTGRIHETAFRKTAGQMPGLPRITYLSFSDFLLPELLERLKLLPSTAAVMLLHHSVDRDANTYTNKQSITAITSAAPAPVFVLTEDRVDYGTLGGRVVSGYLQGKTAAEMALHILRGEPIETIPVLTDSPNRHVFDYNTLARFEIPLSYLPAHSKITNQPRSFYARNKTAVWSVCLTILILSSAVLALALNILRRKRAEHELVEQRAKLSSTLQSITDGVIAVDRNKKILLLNRAAEQLTGCKQEEVAGQAISSLLTVKDESTRQHCAHLLARVLESAETVPHNRCVFVRRDGSELLVSVSAAPIKGGASTVDGAVIAFRDITTEARAQMELERAARLESVGVLAGGLA
ncbi:MAG TPA: ABC transporter substrate binding protein, partial [Oligoflexia bacterium]|nr:ABC transporter substrate binding protein [Oligoflexia bacterium]